MLRLLNYPAPSGYPRPHTVIPAPAGIQHPGVIPTPHTVIPAKAGIHPPPTGVSGIGRRADALLHCLEQLGYLLVYGGAVGFAAHLGHQPAHHLAFVAAAGGAHLGDDALDQPGQLVRR